MPACSKRSRIFFSTSCNNASRLILTRRITSFKTSCLFGHMVLKHNSSNSTRRPCIPSRNAIGAYISKVSRAMRLRFSSLIASRVRILCKRSASLIMITRTSLTIASIILRKFSACASSLDSNSRWVNLLTPSTNSATSSPNSLLRCSFAVSVSSITSCNIAA